MDDRVMTLPHWALGLTVVLCAVMSAPAAQACAPAPAEGMSVSVHAEDALIIWDAARKRQHFIRRADFRQRRLTSAPKAAEKGASGFGFIVPTPTKPELAEAPDALFARLASHTRPRIETYTEYNVAWTLCGGLYLAGAEDAAAPTTASAVTVLDEQRVAGLDAAVLKASDPDALAEWLKDNGYAFRPALRDWLSVYTQQGWIVTAFKIAPSGDAGERSQGVGSGAVRMSFDTDEPFFPYREPSDQEEAYGRQLRVFFAGPSKVKATVGDSERWGARLLFADVASDAEGLFAGALPSEQLPTKLWLTAYLDSKPKRSDAGELMFASAPSKPYVQVERRATTTTIPVFLDVLALLALLGGGAYTLRKRRANRAAKVNQ